MPLETGPGEGSTVERIAALGYDYDAQPKELARRCNLCGPERPARAGDTGPERPARAGDTGPDGRPVEVARQDRYGYPATLVVCRRCGLGYLSPRLSATGYAHFYSCVYRPLVSAYHGRRIDTDTVQAEQRAYGAELAAFLAPQLASAPRTILDVGGSTGAVAGVLATRFDSRGTVLDPAEDELAVARAAGMETVAGFAEDFDSGGRCWDLVLLCQTIDHLLDVRGSLAAMRRMTTTRGRAFVDILDFDLVQRRAGSIEGVAKIDHPYYLTRPTAAAFFALVGYDIVAERRSDDGHRGFVLAPGRPSEPDWPALEATAAEFLRALGAGDPPEITAAAGPMPPG